MNCYLCLMEASCASRPAFAICQRCGAGMCEKHLVEMKVTPVVGMGGTLYATASHRLICWNCYHAAFLTAAAQQPRRTGNAADTSKKSVAWWKYWCQRLWHHPQSTLPDEQEAVATVEQFLKHQRLP